MASIKDVAGDFFIACEAGKGWEVCRAYCRPDATFSSQAGAVADLRSLQQYWMKGLLVILPDGKYDKPGERQYPRGARQGGAAVSVSFIAVTVRPVPGARMV